MSAELDQKTRAENLQPGKPSTMKTANDSAAASPHPEQASLRRQIYAHAPELTVVRQTGQPPPGESPIVTIPCADAFSVITQLTDFPSHKLWRGRRLVHAGGHPEGSIAITHLGDEWRCQHLSTFDNVRFHIPRSAMDAYTEETGKRKIPRLHVGPDQLDPVVFHLAQVLLPALVHPQHASRLYYDQVTLALYAHVTTVYAKTSPAVARAPGKLAAWQESRAREFMQNNLALNLSLEQIARECCLSRAHFARNFKNSTGVSVHAWLQGARIEHAKRLLAAQEQTLSEIAVGCGFVDQSHFTRVFRRAVGAAPGMWRRMVLHLPQQPAG